jgi:aryl-alcohol dehydrogenase-like predicted oxidoreductase
VNIGHLDEEAAYRLMDHAFEHGITFFDTAEEYGDGRAERVIGAWLRRTGCRDRITVRTKVLESAGNIHSALEASLDRLGTEYADIYLMHEFVPNPPLDEILAALTEEAEAGRVRTIGCSNYTPAQLEQALRISRSRGYRRYEVLEPEYNLVMPPVGIDSHMPVGWQQLEDELFPLAAREGIAVTTYSPLGAGFLTGKYANEPPVPPEAFLSELPPGPGRATERNLKTFELLRYTAETHGVPVVRLALAWAMTHPSVTSVLIGPRTTAHIDDAIAAYEMGLDPELRAELTAVVRRVS